MVGGYILGSSRSFKKRIVIIPAILIGIVIAGYGFRRLIQTMTFKMLIAVVERSLNAEISYSAVQGNIFTGVSVSDLSVRLPSGDSLLTSRLQLRYNLFSFVQRRFLIPQIALSAPELFIARARKPGAGQIKGFPNFSVTEFVVENGRVHYGTGLIDSLSGSIGINSRSSKIDFAVRRLTFTFLGLRFGPIVSDLVLKPGSLEITHCSLATGDSKLELSAQADFKQKSYGLTVSEGAVSLKEVSARNCQGVITISGSAGMKGDSAFGEVRFRTRNWCWNSKPLPPLAGAVHFQGDSLKLAVAIGDTVFGNGTVEGAVNYRTRGYRGRLNLERFELASFLPMIEQRFAPVTVSGEVGVSGEGFDRIDCQYALDRTSVAGVEFDRISGRGIRIGELIKIERTVITRGTMETAVEGEIKEKDFRFAYAIEALPLELVGKIVKTDVSGVLNGKGEIFNNGIRGWFRLRNGNWNRFTAPLIEVTIGFDNWRDLAGRMAMTAQDLSYRGEKVGDGAVKLENRHCQIEFTAADSRFSFEGGVSVSTNGFEVEGKRLLFVRNGESIANSQVFTFGKSDRTIFFKDGAFNLAGGQLIASTSFESGKRPVVSLDITGLDLERFGRMLNLKSSPRGILTLSLDTDAGFFASIGIDKLRWGDIALKGIAGRISGDEKSILIEQLRIYSDTEAVALKGTVAYSFEPKTNQFKWKDMNIECQFSNAGAWVLSPLKKVVELKSGRINGTITLTGDPKNPNFGGAVQIANGVIYIPVVRLLCKESNLAFSLNNNKIILTSAKAQVSKATLLATGVIEFGGYIPKRIDFRFRGNDIALNPKKEVYALVSGEFRLGWTWKGPLVMKGELDIDQALLSYQFGPVPGMGGGKPSKNPPHYDITIKGEKGIWLRNNDADIELSIDLQMKGDATGTRFAGELKSLRGALYYLGQRLTITEGEITFINLPKLDPNLNIWAELLTDIETVVEAKPERIKIILHLSGTLTQPTFELYSEPPVLSDNDIIAYLTLSRTWGEFPGEPKDIFTDVMGEKLLDYFEHEVSKRVLPILHLDYLQINGPFGSEPNRVTIGKYVSKNLYLTLTHNIFDVSQDVFQAQYSLGQHHELVGKKNEEGNFSFSYRFKFRY